MKKLEIKIKDQVYPCELTFDALMAIESKIKMRELALAISKGYNDFAAFPFVHLIHAVKCILEANNYPRMEAPFSSEKLYQMFKDGELDQGALVAVALAIVSEVFGVGPEKKSQPETEKTQDTPPTTA